MNASRFFLTFPRCSLPKPDLLANLKGLGRPVTWAFIVQERHADGGLHAHIAVEFVARLNVKSPTFFDPVGGQHGNYQVIKSVPDVLKYLSKFDPEPLTDGEVPSSTKSTGSRGVSNEVATRLQSGASLRSLVTDFPGFCLLNKRKCEEFATFCATSNLPPKTAWPGIWTDSPQLPTREIVRWCQRNLFPPTPRKHSQPQLMIVGATLHQKTSFARRLEEFARIYWVPNEENFDDFYNDEDFDLIVFDEFRGQRSVTWLNSWLDGSTINVRKKGSQGLKRANLPFIILSNDVLSRWIPLASDLPLVRRRLEGVVLRNPIDLDHIYFAPGPDPLDITDEAAANLEDDDQ